MFMIRRLLTTAMLLGTFLGGYYLGRMPGSPDIFDWARNRCGQLSQASQLLAEFTETSQQLPSVSSSEEGGIEISYGGQAYALEGRQTR